jgi:hypothetical protein
MFPEYFVVDGDGNSIGLIMALLMHRFAFVSASNWAKKKPATEGSSYSSSKKGD